MLNSDNPHVDIMGANLYDRYIKRNSVMSLNGNGEEAGSASDDACSTSSVDSSSSLPTSREIPTNAELDKQTVEQCLSMLVGTGVYKHGTEVNKKGPDGQYVYHGHRDIEYEPHLTKPHKYVPDVNQGIEYIFEREAMMSA